MLQLLLLVVSASSLRAVHSIPLTYSSLKNANELWTSSCRGISIVDGAIPRILARFLAGYYV